MKKLLRLSALMAIVAGAVFLIGGAWGIYFTYTNINQEKIVTPADASIPEKPVRGPFTLKAQADAIREHTLKMSGGKTYAQMPRQVVKVDESGQPILDANGKPTMVSNAARDIWITATTLITALHLGILTYVFSALTILFGAISLWTGVVFYVLSRSRT